MLKQFQKMKNKFLIFIFIFILFIFNSFGQDTLSNDYKIQTILNTRYDVRYEINNSINKLQGQEYKKIGASFFVGSVFLSIIYNFVFDDQTIIPIVTISVGVITGFILILVGNNRSKKIML